MKGFHTNSFTLDQAGPDGCIYLRNFKCFGSVGQYIPLSRLNLIFGPNSSGKSSLFQALQVIGDIVYRRGAFPLRDWRFSSLVHNGRVDETIIIGVLYSEKRRPQIESQPFPCFHFIRGERDEVRLHHVEIRRGPHSLFNWTFRDTDGRLVLAPLDPDSPVLQELLSSTSAGAHEEDGSLLERLNIALRETPVTTSVNGGCPTLNSLPIPEGEKAQLQVLNGLLGDSADRIMYLNFLVTSNLPHVRAIRRIPKCSDFVDIAKGETNWVRDAENRIWQLLVASADGAGSSRLLEAVNFWLSDKGIGLGYRLVWRHPTGGEDETHQVGYLVLQDTRNPAARNLDLDLTEVGTGISQVIPVIGAACLHNDMWILMEQPELHLHPRGQCSLADLFLRMSAYPGSLMVGNNVFFLETHSEHLILRTLRRIRESAEGTLPPGFDATRSDHVQVLYFDPTERGTAVVRIPVNAEGDFDRPWPNGFFAERARELM